MNNQLIRKVLFVCIENSCRSQLAESISNHFYSNQLKAYSAGSRPVRKVNPKAISSLKRINITHSGHPKNVKEVDNKLYKAFNKPTVKDELEPIPLLAGKSP